jgi:endonuclease YncB( thermonuclease family)
MKKNPLNSLFCSILICLIGCCVCNASEILQGKVVRVIDGDSIVVKEGKRTHEVRLWGIDCPEYDQPYASFARKLSTKMLKDKTVRVEIKARDSYGRDVAVVYYHDLNVNEELVRQGAAWVYERYCRDSICRKWEKYERNSRADRVGLWAGRQAVPPWKWRKARK